MNKMQITIAPLKVMKLVTQTYEFISSQAIVTDDDILLVATTLAEIIEKNKALKS